MDDGSCDRRNESPLSRYRFQKTVFDENSRNQDNAFTAPLLIFQNSCLFWPKTDPMQIQLITPAERLLLRLLHAEKLKTAYQLSVEKEEMFTNIFVCHNAHEGKAAASHQKE